MFSVFNSAPSAEPYTLEKPRKLRSTSGIRHRSATAQRSRRMNFEEADQIDDDELNDDPVGAIKVPMFRCRPPFQPVLALKLTV